MALAYIASLARSMPIAFIADFVYNSSMVESLRNRIPPSADALAACKNEDPELFFPISYTGLGLLQAERAKTICNNKCPVKEGCLIYALDSNQKDGIWGGMTPVERDALKNKRQQSSRGKIQTTIKPNIK